jgi:hypothetical protein
MRSNEEESDFDAVCQKLNDRLITDFAKCMFLHQTSGITSCTRVSLPTWMVCYIAQILLKDLLSTIRSKLPSKVVDTLGSTDREVNFKVEVNSFVGYAIAEVHKSLLEDLVDDFEGTDGSIQARLDFVSQIRYLDHEAALNPNYLRDCYDGIF